MSKVAVIGECMVELYSTKKKFFKQTFGGDTFNCSVYLKRVFKKADVEYITILGDDELSSKMIKFFHKQKIKTNYVTRLHKRNAGLYMITTKDGERSFSYWRDNSAAKELFLGENFVILKNALMQFDCIYFSAITLAVMSEEGRKNLFVIIKKAREIGIKVVFDSNYRPRLYSSIDEAKNIYNEALKNCDIYLPSLDDEKELWGDIDTNYIIEKAKKAGCNEIVIKCGSKDIVYSVDNEIKSVKTKQLTQIVDSTAAGDSFNGAYLASRLKGKDVEKSIKKARNVASKVILYQGAIIPKKRKNDRKI